MISKNTAININEQINKEFYSGYLYLSIAAYFSENGLCGFSNWAKNKSAQKIKLGLKIFNFLIEQNKNIEFSQIKAPDSNFENLLDALNKMSKNEKFISESINSLYKIIQEDNDRVTSLFIDKYNKKQFDINNEINNLLFRVKEYGQDKTGLLLIDKEL